MLETRRESVENFDTDFVDLYRYRKDSVSGIRYSVFGIVDVECGCFMLHASCFILGSSASSSEAVRVPTFYRSSDCKLIEPTHYKDGRSTRTRWKRRSVWISIGSVTRVKTAFFNDKTTFSGKLTPEIPATAEADENGLKRGRADTVDEVVVPEKKVAVRERKSRFSDIPPEVEPKSSLHDHAAAISMVASIINAQLSGLQTSVLASQIQQPLTPKESRELFVGNVLASGVSEAVLKDFLNSAMKQVGLITGPEDPIVTCRMNAKFSFIELRTPDDAKNALNLNGIPFMGQCLKISRPSKYIGPSYQAKTWQEITGQAPVSSTQVRSPCTEKNLEFTLLLPTADEYDYDYTN